MGHRRLYRSRNERRLAGVAGGIAEYLNWDPTVVRVAWVISVFFMGMGLLLYIILAFVMPLEPIPATAMPASSSGPVPTSAPQASQPAAVAAAEAKPSSPGGPESPS